MLESVLEPMRELLNRYRRVSAAVARAMHVLESELSSDDAKNTEMTDPPRPQVASLEAQSSDVATLLDFQERLSELPGVLKVTIAGAKSGKSTFIVELAPETSGLVVCTNCGKTLVEGPPPASHGLCEECRSTFGTRPR
jgi:hypothetical protein